MRQYHAQISAFVHGIQRFPCQIIQLIQIFHIAANAARLLDRVKTEHGFKQIPLALLNQLPHGMQLLGEHRRGRENALAVLPFGFSEQLPPPGGKATEIRLKGAENFNLLPVPVQ